MYWIFNRTTGLGTAFLDQDDIDGIHARYGSGVGSVTPLAGSWPDRAIEPSTAHRLNYDFTNVPSNRWIDSPLGRQITFNAEDGTLFSSIAAFPTGFGDLFTVSVGGSVLGQFTAEQSVSFHTFPGGGVTRFEIASVDPAAISQSILGFPLKLAFTTPAGSFAATAVPEPIAPVLLILALLAVSRFRRRAGCHC
jgi:hypothetical protein